MKIQLGKRKVQKTAAGSSFIVTLPIYWVRNYGLDDNGLVNMIIDDVGNLVISPSGVEDPAH